MSIGSNLASSVKSLLEKTGTEVTFRRKTIGSYDPATGTATVSTNDDETVKAAFLNYKEEELVNSSVQRDDRKVLLSAYQSDGTALTKTPQTGDILIGEGDTVRLVMVQVIRSGDTTIGYICQARL